MEKTKDQEGNIIGAYCKLTPCANPKFSYSQGGPTSHLLYHLENLHGITEAKHKLKKAEKNQKNEKSLKQANFENITNLSKGIKEKINETLISFIIQANIPFLIVENQFFRKFVLSLRGN